MGLVGVTGVEGPDLLSFQIPVPQRQMMDRDIAHRLIIAQFHLDIFVDREEAQILKTALVIGVKIGPIFQIEGVREEEPVMQVAPAEDIA